MIKEILFLLGGILSVIIFTFVRNKIVKAGKKKILGDNIPIVKTEEKFNPSKFVKGLTDVKSPVSWAKTLSIFLNARVLLILGIIIGVIYGYGYYKGRLGKQPILNWRGKEEWVSLNEHFLHIEKDGTMKVVAEDKETILKKITVGDLDILKKNLRPYGFVLEPCAVAGFGISNAGAGFEGGVGLRYLKWYNWYAGVSVTNGGAYPFGVSYKLTENTSIGINVGTGYKEGERGLYERIMIGGMIKF